MALTTHTQPERRTFLSISHGKVTQGTGADKQLYSSVDGTLKAIYSKTSTFGNEVVNRWYIDLRDGEQLYSICLPYNSGVFKSIVLSLASYKSLSTSTPIRIEPYEGRNGYTKVVVYADGTKLDWVTKELPPQETISVGSRTIRDDSKQMEFISSLASQIVERITNKK